MSQSHAATAVGRGQSDMVYAMVELTQPATTVVYSQRLATLGKASATADAASQLLTVEQEQASFSTTLANANLQGMKEIYRLQRVFNGILYLTPSSNLAVLKSLPGVQSVRLVQPKTLDNAATVPFLGINQLWSLTGTPLHGESIRVGVIDTGIDYTHANFGGPGDAATYLAVDPNADPDPTLFPSAKVVGGFDFAGHDYDAATSGHEVPVPDNNPIDGDYHGSHVSGTIAGYGVNADGSTYGGSYDLSLDTKAMRIGPGGAPLAQLYALKVFGDLGGSTNLAAQALEWATDPNGDGDFSDHLDVVNLSLGSMYGTAADTDAIFYRNATRAGMIVVASAGNSSDVYFVTGAPAATPEVISVAATESDYVQYAALVVNSPDSIKGTKLGGAPDWPTGLPPTSGDVAVAAPYDGCAALTNPADVAGKMALIQRGSCTFAVKIKNAQDAGAIGALIVNNNPTNPGGMSVADHTITIPSRMIRADDGAAINSTVTGGTTVNVTIDNSMISYATNEGDQMASFSSRGPTRVGRHPVLKPDVAAPGFNIISTGMGTGNESQMMSGTSMSSPAVTGVMALLRQAHPTWSVAQLKALVMNTANHDLYTLAINPATKVNPGRVGAGRADPVAAVNSAVIAYDKDAPERVSVSFEMLDVAVAQTEVRTIQLQNTGATDVTYAASIAPYTTANGTTVTFLSSTPVTVPANGTVDVQIQLAADPVGMTRVHDSSVSETNAALGGAPRFWLSETTGYVVFTSASAPTLRVPYYAALNPSSSMSAEPLQTSGLAGTGSFTLKGHGINTTAITPAPKGAVSLVAPFELLHASPLDAPIGFPAPDRYDIAETNNANLQYVGVTSNLLDAGTMADAELFFGLTTYGVWGSPREVEFDVYIKKAGAPDWQYVAYNADPGGSSPTDVFYSALVDLSTSSGGYEDYLNGLSATRYYLPIYMSNAMTIPVYAADLGLTDGDSAIEFQIVSFCSGFSGPVDATPVLRYDLASPTFAMHRDTSLTRLNAYDMPIWTDKDGQQVPVTYDLANGLANQVGGLLLLHYLNPADTRGEVVSVAGLTCKADTDCMTAAAPHCDVASGICLGCISNADCGSGNWCDMLGTRSCQACAGNPECDPDCRVAGNGACAQHTYCSASTGQCLPVAALVTTTPEPAGATCTAGGALISSGLDDNNDGVLEPSEVQSSYAVCNAVSQLVRVTNIAIGDATCPDGGQLIESGADTNGNLVLDPSEVTYSEPVCNGLDTLVAVSAEAAGTNCQYGGQRIDSGVDTDGSGTLDSGEITSTSYVCNGAPGADGSNGSDGTNGTNGHNSLVSTTQLNVGDSNCAYGGVAIHVGVDLNDNGVLDVTEIASTSYVCTGATGSTGSTGSAGPTGPQGPAGLTSLIKSTQLSVGNANCAFGGVELQMGVDSNSDGSLQAGEITGTVYICTGATGSTGATGPTGPQGPAGPAGADGADGTNGTNGHNALVVTTQLTVGDTNCPFGGVRLQAGVDANDDGQLTGGEITYTTYACTGANGTNGTDGTDGSNGTNGSNGSNGANGVSALVNTVALASGDTNCATGGLEIQVGLDTDANGTLDASEVQSTSYVCNGAAGATGAQGDTGPTGPAGATGAEGPSGCNAMGGAEPSILMLLGLVGMVVRRRRK